MLTIQKGKKRAVIIGVICLFIAVFLALGILFYKANQAPQQEEVVVDSKKDSKPENTKIPEIILSGEEQENVLEALTDNPEETIISSAENETEASNRREDANELADVSISHTKSLFGEAGLLPENLPAGKVYFQGNNGKLESFIKNEGTRFSEQLISSDSKGNKVDELEIGVVEEAGKSVKYAVISKNKISVFEMMPAKKGKKAEERVTEYTITRQMRFAKGKTYVRLM
jgi:hypothetical protein